MAEASWPTGEVTASLSELGGWKPMTAYSLRRHSGRGLSGRPPSDPFRLLNRATRLSISARGTFRIVLQSLMGCLLTLISYPMNKLRLTLAVCDYDRTKTIFLG